MKKEKEKVADTYYDILKALKSGKTKIKITPELYAKLEADKNIIHEKNLSAISIYGSIELIVDNGKDLEQDKTISNYCKMRDDLFINFEKMSDLELLQRLIELNGDNIPSSPEIARIGLHKARLYSNNVPIELKEKSKKWLLDNNYDLEIY